MAKWGEGDPRWIVEQRPDVKNVGNWHWVEKDCTGWSKTYLTDNLTKIAIEDGSHTLKVLSVTINSGEVTVTCRKAKVKYFYDLEVKVRWEVTGGARIAGDVVFPEVSQDEDPDEFEFAVSVDDDKSEKEFAKKAIRNKLVPELKKAFRQFSKDLYETHGASLILPTKDGAPPVSEANGAQPTAANGTKSATSTSTASTPAQNGTKKETQKKSTTSKITMTVEFLASAADVFDALTNPMKVRAWSASEAVIKPEKNSEFHLYGGNVSGTIIEATPGSELVMSWRLKTWPAGHYSTCQILITQGSDSSKITLIQEGVPSGEVESTESNWNNFYFNRIKAVFGYGSF